MSNHGLWPAPLFPNRPPVCDPPSDPRAADGYALGYANVGSDVVAPVPTPRFQTGWEFIYGNTDKTRFSKQKKEALRERADALFALLERALEKLGGVRRFCVLSKVPFDRHGVIHPTTATQAMAPDPRDRDSEIRALIARCEELQIENAKLTALAQKATASLTAHLI